jgi:hypothetical protein
MCRPLFHSNPTVLARKIPEKETLCFTPPFLRQAQVLKSHCCPVIFYKKSPDNNDFSKPELVSETVG